MESVSILVSKSAKLQGVASRSDEQYDRQIRDLIASLRQSLSSKALGFAANDLAILDVGSSFSLGSLVPLALC